jgi:ABC-type uncharacterized transport system permease subunit
VSAGPTLVEAPDRPAGDGGDGLDDSGHRRAVGRRLRGLGLNVALYLVAMGIALGLAALLVVTATDASPSSVFTAMYDGSLKNGGALGLTVDEATPILVVALGAVIASRASIINIGQEGQLIVGAMAGTAVALHVGGPHVTLVVLSILGAAIGGAVWAGISALLRYTRGIDVVISTLLLNFVAFEAVSFAVNRTWLLQEPHRTNIQSLAQSDQIPPGSRLPRLGSFPAFNVSSGLFIALALTAVVWVMLSRSRWGFRLRLLGQNPQVARRAGVSVAVLGGGALLLSGAFAGAAGGVMLTGTVFRLQPGFSQNVGFEGLLAALIARSNALWVIPVAFFFGVLRAGGGFLASTGVPGFLVDIVQALLVLATLFPPVFLEWLDRRRAQARARAAAREPLPADVAVAVGA